MSFKGKLLVIIVIFLYPCFIPVGGVIAASSAEKPFMHETAVWQNSADTTAQSLSSVNKTEAPDNIPPAELEPKDQTPQHKGSTLQNVEKILQNLFLGALFIIIFVAGQRLWLRKKLQANRNELNQTKERFDSFIKNAPIGIFKSTMEGSFLAANEQFSEIFGYSSPKELIEEVQDIGKEIYGDPQVRQEILTLLNHREQVVNHETIFVRRDGTLRWGTLSMRKVVNSKGDITLEGFVQDITAQKTATQAIEESQSLLKLAMEVANAGSWQHFLPSRKVHQSPDWYKVLGFEPNEFDATEDNWMALVHPDDKPKIEEHRKSFEAPFNQAHWEIQYRMRNKAGFYQWVLSKAQVFSRDENGKPTVVMGIILDIQKFKDAETRLKLEVLAKEETKKRLEYEAYHDPLTALGNRSKCMRDIQDVLDDKKNSDFLGLIFFDIENFGQVNQAYGHSVGDELLQAIARNLLHLVSGQGKAHRVGGDQFAVLKTGKSAVDFESFGRYIRERLLTTYFIQGEKIEIDFVFGIGFNNNDNEKADSILNMAVLAHKEAKKRKDGTLVIYDQDISEKENRRLTIGKNIKTGLVNGEFYLKYQPLINSRTGLLHGCEALLRWENPQYGTISPGEFIPVAEETGQISMLGEWALENAFRYWTVSGMTFKGLILSINVSGHQFSQQGFSEQIETLLSRTKVDPKTVELEVTETALMKNARESVTKLTRLRKLGVRISIDDFGTGYSSLDYLHQLSADTLKIDLSFVQKLERDEKTQEIVRAMINLARIFEMEVVGEGVETENQKDILRNLTCDFLQGYLFSRPVEGTHLLELLDRKFF